LLAVVAPHFFSPQPLLSRLAAQSPVLVVAVGMTLVMLCRQIDISVGAQFGMCGVIAAVLAGAGLPFPVVAALTVLAGGAMGAMNGLLAGLLGVPSIVVTLATMVTWQEAVRLWQQGRLIPLPRGTQWFGLPQTAGQWLLVTVALLLFLAVAWGLRNLAAGRRLYAVGSDAEAARLAGIDPRSTTFAVFLTLGMLTGFAALMNGVQSPQVQPTAGDGLELKIIAACVVGGIAVNGGRGRLWGVFPGLLLLSNVNPALTHLQVEAYWERAVQGAVILIAVLADRGGGAK
jgi:rhamnose transport system permease protein